MAWRARPGGLSSPIPPTLSKAATGECHREGVRASCPGLTENVVGAERGWIGEPADPELLGNELAVLYEGAAEQAASVPLVGLTAWQALIEKAKLQPGQKVLIHAGSGGVGTIAIQLAKHLGATVATTTSTPNVEWVKSLGADVVIDYKADDFATVLRDYDVVLDTRGGETLEKSLRVLKPGGKVISVAGPPEPNFAKEFGVNWLLIQAMRVLSFRIRRKAKQRGVTYSFLFMKASGDQLRELGGLIDSGVIRPVVDRVFPFQSTTDALAYVEKGRAKGKVVVKVR